MTNLTPLISSILVTAHTSIPIEKHVHSPERLDTFLQEAYRINAHITSLLLYLRQIRQPYLSTAAPPPTRHRTTTTNNTHKDSSTPDYLTDPQRAQIDTQTSTLLHDLSSNISSLTAAENLRSSTETALLERKFGKADKKSILWRWAAGDDGDVEDEALGKSAEQIDAEGKVNTIKTFREGVLWYLGWKLQEVVEVQRGMVEIRAAREREKEKSVLWKMKAGANNKTTSTPAAGGQIPRRTGRDSDAMNGGTEADYKLERSYNPNPEDRPTDNDDNENQIPPHLLTLFAAENSTLLEHYNTTLTKIAQAESSLLEISSLQSTLLSHLGTQSEMIEGLVQDAQGTGENVQRGNRELKRAGERWGRGLARGVFWGTVGVCGVAVGWDLIF